MIKFSDVYVQTVARGLFHPGEQFMAACAASYQSFFTFNIPFFRHAYLLIATSERLIVVDHRKGLFYDRMDRVESYPWSAIGSLKVGGIFAKKVVVKDTANRVVLKAKAPGFLAPIANNSSAARALVHAWEQGRALGAAPAYAALPAQQQGFVATA